jgi:hypothetical protein
MVAGCPILEVTMHHVRPFHPRLRRLRPVLAGAVAVLALALPGSALAGGFTAHLYAATHQPRVGYMPITVTATRGAQKLSGSVNYQFLFNGVVVSHQPGGRFTHGVYHDKLKWPGKAVGHTIYLQVVVSTRYGTDYLNWWIKVRR